MRLATIKPVFILLSLILFGCGEASRQNLLPRNTGAKGEFIIVAPSQVWSTSYKDALNQTFNKALYGLPQEELMLSHVEVKTSGFKDMFKTHRNILKIEVDPKQKSTVKVKHDVFARQQLYINIRLSSLEDLPNVLDSRGEQILQLFHDAEIDRLIERNKDFGSKELVTEVAEITGLEIILQDKFQIAVNKDGFLWLRLDQSKPLGGYQHTISQGLMVYRRPYQDTSFFSDSSLYAWKNTVNQQFIEGPKNSHMTISEKFILPKSKLITFHDQTAKEIRGLWRMDSYFMGGPFYAMAFYNPKDGYQYMVEGYAYAPQFDKASLIREIEAMVKSVEPVESADRGAQGS